MQSVKVVACPQCGAASPVTPENRWRPFCSERCRLIDLGQWAAEEHRVPGEAAEPDEDATPKPPGS